MLHLPGCHSSGHFSCPSFWLPRSDSKQKHSIYLTTSLILDGRHLRRGARPAHLQWQLRPLLPEQLALRVQGDEEFSESKKARRISRLQPVFACCRPQQSATTTQQQQEQYKQWAGPEQDGQLQLQPTTTTAAAGRRHTWGGALARSLSASRSHFWPFWLAVSRLCGGFKKLWFRHVWEPSVWWIRLWRFWRSEKTLVLILFMQKNFSHFLFTQTTC